MLCDMISVLSCYSYMTLLSAPWQLPLFLIYYCWRAGNYLCRRVVYTSLSCRITVTVVSKCQDCLLPLIIVSVVKVKCKCPAKNGKEQMDGGSVYSVSKLFSSRDERSPSPRVTNSTHSLSHSDSTLAAPGHIHKSISE